MTDRDRYGHMIRVPTPVWVRRTVPMNSLGERRGIAILTLWAAIALLSASCGSVPLVDRDQPYFVELRECVEDQGRVSNFR